MVHLQRLTPNLVVPSIEACLPFWCDRLGFTRTAEVPHGSGLGFVILERDGVQLMLQSEASVADDLPAVLEGGTPRGNLFLVVSDIEEVVRALEGVQPALERRTTFYGMVEVGYRDPAGTFVLFAQPTGEAQG